MAAARARCLATGTSFGIETTFTRRWRLALLENASARGFAIDAILIGTDSPRINVRRVRERAERNEGHRVPESTVRRRWKRVQENLIAERAALRSIRIIDSTNDPPVETARLDTDGVIILTAEPSEWVTELVRRLEQQPGKSGRASRSARSR